MVSETDEAKATGDCPGEYNAEDSKEQTAADKVQFHPLTKYYHINHVLLPRYYCAFSMYDTICHVLYLC